jgi:hypothetical protein
VLVWIPPAFLLVFSPLIIASLLERKPRIQWNLYNKIRQLLSTAQIILLFSECITILDKYFHSQEVSLLDVYGAIIRLFFSVKTLLIVKNDLLKRLSDFADWP